MNNNGVKSEKKITEQLFGMEWKKDSKPYNTNSDIELNNLKISLKSNHFTLAVIKKNNEYLHSNAKESQHLLNEFIKIFVNTVHSDYVIFEHENICYLYTMDNFIKTFKNNLKLENDSRTKKEKEMGINGKLKIRCRPLPKAEISKLEKLALISFSL